MILKGSQRGNAKQLASHLSNRRDNDHISIEQIRGFVSDDLAGAFNEAHAISKGTRCKQFLFSLSLNPPKKAQASIEQFMDAIERAESTLGLDGQPRVVIFHEKEGRRHAHVVWSRIDAEKMKAINLPHFKTKLKTLSKELYLEHGWELPRGHRENDWKNPLNFTLAEWQQAKRLDLDPREIKQVFRDAWERSDNQKSFARALEEHGYYLAKGDRRGFVAVDVRGEVYSVARWAGVRAKDVRAKLGDPKHLPSVDQTRASIHGRLSNRLRVHLKGMKQAQREDLRPILIEHKRLVEQQRIARAKLLQVQAKRWKQETKERSNRLHKGLLGVWELLTGKASAIRRQNDFEADQGRKRDRNEREKLFYAQMKDRRTLQKRLEFKRSAQMDDRLHLARKVAAVLRHTRTQKQNPQQSQDHARHTRGRGRDFDLDL